MKLTLKITIATIILLFLGFVFGIWLTYPPNVTQGATGSKFSVDRQYLHRSSTYALILSNFDFGTTSPTYVLAEATTTPVRLTTNGVSDLRINISAFSSTTANVTFDRKIIGYGQLGTTVDDNFYSEGSLSAGLLTPTPVINWSKATTTKSNNANESFDQISYHITNINAPYLEFEFSASEPVGLSVEFVKIIPN